MAPKFGLTTVASTMKIPTSWADIVDDENDEKGRLLAQQAALRERLNGLNSQIAAFDDNAHQEKLDARRKQLFKLQDVLFALQTRFRKVEASILARLTDYLKLQQAVTDMRQTKSVQVKACSPRPSPAEDEDSRQREQLLEEQSALKKRLQELNSAIFTCTTLSKEHDARMTQDRKELFEAYDVLAPLQSKARELSPSVTDLLVKHMQHQKDTAERKTTRARKPRRPTQAYYMPPHQRRLTGSL